MESDYQFGAMLQDLRELGYVEGKNLVIEWRFADGKYERFAGMAAELVQSKVDVIVTGGPLPRPRGRLGPRLRCRRGPAPRGSS